MRIISQNGKVDLPYECLGVEIDTINDTTIIAYTVNSDDDTVWKVAEYSTKAKAEKAMEELRETYIGMPIVMQNVYVPEDMAKAFERLKKCSVVVRADNQPSKVEYINNVIFKFPKDDEIEV